MALDGSQMAAQDKRKEKARVAARARRSQEASIIMEMAEELHITQEKIRRIDKATIVRLAIDYIKAFEILCRFHTIFLYNKTSQPVEKPTICNQLVAIENSINTSSQHHENISNQNLSYSHQYYQINNHQHYKRPSEIQPTPTSQRYQNEEARDLGKQQTDHQQLEILNGTQEAPKLSTGSIFSPKTDEVDSYFLMINEREGRPAYVLKPDSEILDDDDLTHLAPQAGDESIALDVEPLEGIQLDGGLFLGAGYSSSPPPKKVPPPLSPVSLTKELAAMGQI